jgi:hypothetical protein
MFSSFHTDHSRQSISNFWRPVAGERLDDGTLSSGEQQLTVLVDVGKPSWEDEDARMLQHDLQ